MTSGRTALLLLLALVRCRGEDRSGRAPDSAAAVAVATPEAGAPLAPSRCGQPDTTFAIDHGKRLDGLEIGDTLTTPGGTVVDVVHQSATGRFAALAMLPPDLSSVRVRDLGPTLGYAPPPRVAARGDGFVAAAYGESKRRDARELVVYRVTASGDSKATATLTQQPDDSLAFDLSPSLVAWDEVTTGSRPRGVIRLAELTADGHVRALREVSPPELDADTPRLVPSGAGCFVFWMARKPAGVVPFDGLAAPEAPGKAPASSWLEVALVDIHGVLSEPPRRLTPLAGHVSAYDVQALPTSGGSAEVLVVARNDVEAVDGSAGALLHFRVREDGADVPMAYPTDGLGRGGPSIVDASPPWLTWVALRGQARLLPLDATGLPGARPSAEPQLNEGRPLLMVGRRLLAAAPASASAQLLVLNCAP